MGYTEFVVEVQVADCPLCAFTEDHEDAALVVAPLGAARQGPPGQMQVTVLGGPDVQADLEEVLSEWAGTTSTLRSSEACASYVAEGVAGDGFERVLPIVADLVGEDVVFQPSIGRDGWIALRFLALPAGHPAELVQAVQERIDEEGHGFRLIRFNAFDSEEFAGPLEPLTDKQLEVVRVAYSMGYYETPRNCTLEDLAEVFGISKAALHMRLRSAEEKIIEEII